MNIVIEPFDDPEEDAPAASESRDRPDRSQGTIAPAEIVRRRVRRGSPPSAAWVVAAAATACALATLVAVPGHNRSGSAAPTTTPTVILDRADPLPPIPGPLIVNPVLAAACDYLFGVAADALATDPDTYARAALTASGTQGRSLNDVVHDDLAALRDQVLRLPIGMPGGSAATVEALELALVRADAAPCSLRETPATQPSSWAITEAP